MLLSTEWVYCSPCLICALRAHYTVPPTAPFIPETLSRYQQQRLNNDSRENVRLPVFAWEKKCQIDQMMQ